MKVKAVSRRKEAAWHQFLRIGVWGVVFVLCWF